MGICFAAKVVKKKAEEKKESKKEPPKNIKSDNKNKYAVPSIVVNKDTKTNTTSGGTKVAKIQKLNVKTHADDLSAMKEIDTVYIVLVVEGDFHYFVINDPLQQDKVDITERKRNSEFKNFIDDFDLNLVEDRINSFIHEKCNFSVEKKLNKNYLVGKLKECPPGSEDTFKYEISKQQ